MEGLMGGAVIKCVYVCVCSLAGCAICVVLGAAVSSSVCWQRAGEEGGWHTLLGLSSRLPCVPLFAVLYGSADLAVVEAMRVSVQLCDLPRIVFIGLVILSGLANNSKVNGHSAWKMTECMPTTCIVAFVAICVREITT
jgi:hypothetical protein